MKRCPKCLSDDIKEIDYMGTKMILCRNCGYDERDMHDVFAEGRVNQKAKKEFSPYKTGGKNRILK